jgi:RNA polymerase sigma-70 factor (ECF subfamily)
MKVGDEFRAIYEAAFPAVYRSVYLLCRDPGTAEDATQEAFARAVARWHRLRGQPWLVGWLTTTAMNAARRASRRKEIPVEDAVREGEAEASIEIWDQVRRLPKRQQEAVVLYYVEDLPVSQVSAAMRCREGTVRALLAQARARLRTTLEVE